MKLANERFLAELRDQDAQIVAVLVAEAEELAQEDIVDIQQGHLQPTKWRQRVGAILPAARKVVCLDVSEVQPVALLKRLNQSVVLPYLLRHLADHVDVVG